MEKQRRSRTRSGARSAQSENATNDRSPVDSGDLPESEWVAYLRNSAEITEQIALATLSETGANRDEIDAITRDPASWIGSIPPQFDRYLELAKSTEDMARLVESQRGKIPQHEVINAHSLVAAVTLAKAIEMSRSALQALELSHTRKASRELLHTWNLLLDAGTRISAQGAAYATAKHFDHKKQLNEARSRQNLQRREAAETARSLAIQTLFPQWRKANQDSAATRGYEHVATVLTERGYKNANGAAITWKTVKGYFRKPRKTKRP